MPTHEHSPIRNTRFFLSGRLAAPALLITALLTALALPATAADVPVTVSSDVFKPAGVVINLGDSVTWENVQGVHNVVADDGSFSSGEPSEAPWTYTHTFTEPGTFIYHCTLHGEPGGTGHSGSITVDAGAASQVSFVSRSFVVDEDAGLATLTVRREGGTDDLATVNYSTIDTGSATQGIDFEETAGTITWEAGDGNDKTITIPIFDDAEVEGGEIFQVILKTPINAELGSPAVTDVTIIDNETGTAGCEPTNTTLCLFGDRFQVRATFTTLEGASGQAKAVPLTSATGYFWFFTDDNVEVVLKIRDGCSNNGFFWVFAGGLTNVQVNIRVLDTLTGTLKVYNNPVRTAFEPIQDTRALATCTS